MRVEKLIYNGKTYTKSTQIVDILEKENLYWLIDSEIEDAVIEVVNHTLIWYSGNLYSGNWHYGIWKGGSFHGIWENGIWENGFFQGKWLSGIKEKAI